MLLLIHQFVCSRSHGHELGLEGCCVGRKLEIRRRFLDIVQAVFHGLLRDGELLLQSFDMCLFRRYVFGLL